MARMCAHNVATPAAEGVESMTGQRAKHLEVLQ